MENVNIKNMLAELKREFPDNWGDEKKGIYIFWLHDYEEHSYILEHSLEEDGFEEEIFAEITLYYKGSRIEIRRKYITSVYPTYEISVQDYIDNEDIKKIIDIVFKHIKKISQIKGTED